ncbi:PAS domain-containing protein [Candidatus Sumerlaeota bacterium]|nr:PAS domain-containing protein [Candidatus Sumerlaeota bacterium]
MDDGSQRERVDLSLTDQVRDELQGHLVEQQRQGRELIEDLEHLRQTLDHIPSGLAILDGQGRIQLINPVGARLRGAPMEDLLGKAEREVSPPELRDHLVPLLCRAIESRRSVSEDFTLDLRGGRLVCAVTYVPLLDERGEIKQILAITHDVTEHRRQQEAIGARIETLREKVAEHTAVSADLVARLRALNNQLLLTEERERRQLASDLHDNLGQVLTLAKVKLTALRRAFASKTHRGDLEAIEQLIAQANESVRSLTFQLSPPMLHELGLAPTLEWLAGEMTRLYGLHVDLTVDEPLRGIDEGARNILYRAVREMLINASKHSGVGRAAVSLRRDGPCALVTVEDQGVGFDVAEITAGSAQGGFGLFNISEQLRHLGGSVEIHSEPGAGVRVELTVPISIDSSLQSGESP